MGKDLTDKIVVITGASSGIGRATAVACAQAGMNAVINARRADKLKAVAEQIESMGRKAEIVCGDVTDPETSARLLDAATQCFGGFDVVFANAGYGVRSSVCDMEDWELREMFEVNFFAANGLLREAARRLIRERRRGHLLMCSSSVARFALPRFGAYCATKSAQAHICQALRAELRPYHICVSSVHPIGTTTEFYDVVGRRSHPGENAASLLQQTPQRFIQSPELVARAVVACLRKPRPEVWTSHTVRWFAAAVTAFPSLARIVFKDTPLAPADRA